MTMRLHVLLGAGGVGKTTLAAGYALSLARDPGRQVGLLGIDPSYRLQDALRLPLHDTADVVPGSGLRAALLQPPESLRRWVAESCPDPRARERLLRNPFFVALADHLAAATDIFAAARVAEWVEREPATTDLVVDTAPGLNAIEFLTRPERVASFLGGRLVGWLRWLARGDAGGSAGRLRGGARQIAGSLSRIAGSRALGELAEFFSLIEAVFARLLVRVELTERRLREPSTELLVVTCVRHDGAALASELVAALSGAGLAPRAIVVNRALPAELAASRAALEEEGAREPRSAPVIRYALASAAIQARILEDLARQTTHLAPRIVVVPDAGGLDGGERLSSLESLGDVLRAGLE